MIQMVELRMKNIFANPEADFFEGCKKAWAVVQRKWAQVLKSQLTQRWQQGMAQRGQGSEDIHNSNRGAYSDENGKYRYRQKSSPRERTGFENQETMSLIEYIKLDWLKSGETLRSLAENEKERPTIIFHQDWRHVSSCFCGRGKKEYVQLS